MEYDFTIVISLSNKDQNFFEFIQNIENNEQLKNIIIASLNNPELERKKTFEIEVELKMNEDLKITEPLIYEYLRNIESLYNDDLESLFYSNFMRASQDLPFQSYECPRPLFGKDAYGQASDFWKKYLK